MLTLKEIAKFIDNDRQSSKKKYAAIGRRYYEAEHDIKNMKLYYFNADGQMVEDKTRSNIKISHPFFTELVDQEVQYIMSCKDGFVFSDKPELQEYLDEYFNKNEKFKAEFNELLTGVITEGFGYMYAYKDTDNKTHFECANAGGVVEVRAKETEDECDYIIYWYVDRLGKDGKEIVRIQVWNDKETYYFIRKGFGKVEKDPNAELNPRPHILFTKPNDKNRYFDNYGLIPFFRMDNNKNQVSGLRPIKAIIDDYDLMSCGLSNNLQDANEYYAVVSGFQGDSLDELIQNVRTKKVIGVDKEGGIDFKTVDIPYEARKIKLELDEKNIYKFGMGFNSAQIGDGNITNIVIKSRYALLDIKTNKFEYRIREFLEKILNLVLEEVNKTNKTDYKKKDCYFEFKREIITNASDNSLIEKTNAERKQVEINTLLNLTGKIDDETIIKRICEVLDINYEDIKNKIPTNEENYTLQALEEIDGSLN